MCGCCFWSERAHPDYFILYPGILDTALAMVSHPLLYCKKMRNYCLVDSLTTEQWGLGGACGAAIFTLFHTMRILPTRQGSDWRSFSERLRRLVGQPGSGPCVGEVGESVFAPPATRLARRKSPFPQGLCHNAAPFQFPGPHASMTFGRAGGLLASRSPHCGWDSALYNISRVAPVVDSFTSMTISFLCPV